MRRRARWGPFGGAIGVATGALIGAAMVLPSLARAQSIPSPAEVRAAHRPSDVTVLDRHGVPVQTVRVDRTVRRLDWVPLEAMSPALLQAIVLSEDRRFHEHSGVDWAAVARSAWANVWNTRTQGASTLTMQLAGLLDADLARPGAGRSVAQKLGQAWTARALEARWTKAQILEAYLNRVAWRGELVGIGALSQTLFGKYPSGLDREESAIAVALVRAPNATVEAVARRACGVLQAQGLACQGVLAQTQLALTRRPGMPLGEQLAPHYARQWLRAADGAPRSTLDARLQRTAVQALREQLAELRGRAVEDGAVLVLDNASGEVLAWVGSSGALSDAPEVDGVLARRQPGSTLKPFVYELAFERRLITPASLIDDAPVQLATRTGVYAPQNYERDFKGWVSARSALGASLNVPAVKVAAMLPPDALFNRLNDFGLALSESGGYHGQALALGAADVSLLALTNAYRALANGGQWQAVNWRGSASKAAPPRRRVADAAAVHLVTDILADDSARLRTFDVDSALVTRGFAAVKTGTSKDLRDNWCVGFTDRYTIGVWVGNASGAPMHGVSGVSGAAPVWQRLVRALHAQQVSRPPADPPGVVRTAVRFDLAGAGLPEPPRREVFLRGSEQATVQLATRPGSTRPGAQGIVHPRDGSLFAIDPDIPPQAQRIRFEGEEGTWLLDGRPLGRGAALAWSPWPGRHELSLKAPDGRLVQTVRFEVRGAGVKAGVRPGVRPSVPSVPSVR